MASKVHEKAKDIEAFLHGKPEATAADIAAKTGLEESQVSEVLDSHFVGEDGSITNRGAGKGGGWHPSRLAERQAEEE